MGRALMCADCRRRKVKCTPSERTWEDGGLQSKCDRCVRYNHQCGPAQYSSQHLRPRESQNTKKMKKTSLLAEDKRCILRVANESSTPMLFEQLAEDKLELKRKLTIVDERVEVWRILQDKLQLATDIPCRFPDYTALLSLKKANLDQILSLLRLAIPLADGLEMGGETDAAENAYIRIMNIYRRIDTNALYEVKGILRKLSSLNWKLGQEQRGQDFAWEGLQCRDTPLLAERSDLDWLLDLGKSLSRTRNYLANVVRLTVGIAHPRQLTTPTPVLHKMMESGYASSVTGNIFWTTALSDATDEQHPIVGGMKSVLDFVRQLRNVDLEARDSEGRSPLFMAALLGKEPLGLAIMIRANEIPAMKDSIMDARDHTSQTILGISISSNCSLPFIEELIYHGADLNPVMVTIMNPIQAASWDGLLDVVGLLMKYGAKTDWTLPDGKTAMDLAEGKGHHNIVQLLKLGNSDCMEPLNFQPLNTDKKRIDSSFDRSLLLTFPDGEPSAWELDDQTDLCMSSLSENWEATAWSDFSPNDIFGGLLNTNLVNQYEYVSVGKGGVSYLI